MLNTFLRANKGKLHQIDQRAIVTIGKYTSDWKKSCQRERRNGNLYRKPQVQQKASFNYQRAFDRKHFSVTPHSQASHPLHS